MADDLVEHGRVRKPWLGVRGDDDASSAPGAVVGEVMGGSPAAAAGIRDGDVILEVAGLEVRSMSSLRVALRRHRPGEVVAVVLLRDDERLTVEVALAERSAR